MEICSTPRLSDVPVDSVHGLRFFRRQIELVQDELVGLWIVLNPFPNSNFEGPVFHVVEYLSSGLVLISSEEGPLPSMLEALDMEFFFPHILVHLGAGNPSIGSIGFRVIAHPVGYDSEQLVRRTVVPEDSNFRIAILSPVGGHLPHDRLLILFGVGFQIHSLKSGLLCTNGYDGNRIFEN